MTQLLLSELNSSIYYVVGLFLAFVILREVLIRQTASLPLIYYLILFPGVIVHELSHTFACIISFTPIKSLKLFSKSGGFVLHQKPRFLFVSFFISAAPVILGLAILYFSFHFLQNQYELKQFNATTFFLFYFTSSVLITMLPSRQDVLNATSVYITIAVIGVSYFFLSSDKSIFTKINIGLIISLIILIILNVLVFSIKKIKGD
ncbi:MAG: M50 family metallopeptidase [bacterium]